MPQLSQNYLNVALVLLFLTLDLLVFLPKTEAKMLKSSFQNGGDLLQWITSSLNFLVVPSKCSPTDAQSKKIIENLFKIYCLPHRLLHKTWILTLSTCPTPFGN